MSNKPTDEQLIALGEIFARYLQRVVASELPVILEVPSSGVFIAGSTNAFLKKAEALEAAKKAEALEAAKKRNPAKPSHN